MNLFSTFASLRKTVAGLGMVTLIAGMFATGVATAVTSHTFTDVPADAWFAQYVNGLADAGAIDSTGDMYRPGDLVNRAEMSKFAFTVSGLPLEHAAAAPFKDVAMGQWYTDYIYTLSKNGIVSGDKKDGVPTGYFRPSDALNRAEATKMLVNAAQMAEDLSGAPHFPDVKSADWFYNFVETAFNNGVVAGYPDGTFGPAKNINRAEVSKMVYLSMNPVSAGFTLDSAAAASTTTVELIYSMNAEKASSETVANYTIEDSSGNPLVVSAAKQTAPDTVLLTAATQTKGKVYYVTAKNVKSEAGEALSNTDSVSFLGYGADVSGGDLKVSLSTETPVAGSIPMGATGVVFTCWDFTGGATASMVKSLNVHRVGPGAESAFDNVYLYNGDTRVTTGRSINNASQSVEFSNVNQNVAAGQNVKICLVGDIANLDVSGGVHAFELANAAAVSSNSSSMTGSFPLRGADQLITSAVVGSATVSKNGSLDEVTVGTTGARVAQFQINTLTEDQQLNRIALYVRGSVPVTAVQNMKLYVEGNATALASVAGVGASDLATMVLSTPYKISKGQTKIFYVTADISGARNGDDVKVYLDQATDVYITGLTYGYGTQVVISSYDGGDADSTPGTSDDQYSYVLLKGSKFTIAFNGPVASDVIVNQKQAKCMAMTLTNAAGLDVTIKDWVVTLAAGNVAGAADGLVDTTGTAAANYTNIQLARLNDDGTIGGVLLGSDELDTAGNDSSQNVTLRGTSSIASGESVKAAVIFDVANNDAASFTSNDTIRCSLLAPTGDSQIKDSNNDPLGATNITPSSTIGGNTMTISASSLTFAKNSSPANYTKVAKGTSNATLLSFQATAGSSQAVTIKSLTVNGDNLLTTVADFSATSNGAGTIAVTAGFPQGAGYVTGTPVAIAYANPLCTAVSTMTMTVVAGAITAMPQAGTLGVGCAGAVTLTVPSSTQDINNIVDSLGIYDDKGVLVAGGTLKSFPASAVSSNSAEVTFNNLSIPVAKNGSVNLFLKGMVSNSLSSAAMGGFYLTGTPLVIDSEGQTVTGVNIDAVDGSSQTKELVLTLGSTPSVASSAAATNDAKMFAEAQSNPVYGFTLKSTNGASTLQDMTVNVSTTTGDVLPIDSIALYSTPSAGVCDSGTTLVSDYKSITPDTAIAGHVKFTALNKTLADSVNSNFCVLLKSSTVSSGSPISNADIVLDDIVFDKVQDQSGSTLTVSTITPSVTSSVFFKGVPTFTPTALASSVLSSGTNEVLKFTAGSIGTVDTVTQLSVTLNESLATGSLDACSIYRGNTLVTVPAAETIDLAVTPGVDVVTFDSGALVSGAMSWTNGQTYTVKCNYSGVTTGDSAKASLAPVDSGTSSFDSAIIWDDGNGATLTDLLFTAVDDVLFLNNVEATSKLSAV